MNFGIVVYCARALPMQEFASFAFMLVGILLLSSLQQGLVGTPAMTLNALIGAEEKQQYDRGLLLLQLGFLVIAITAFYVFLRIGVRFGREASAPAHEVIGCVYLACRLFQEFCRRYHIANGNYFKATLSDTVLVSGTLLGLCFFSLRGEASLVATLGVLSISALLGSWFPLAAFRPRFERKAFSAVMSRHLKSGVWYSFTTAASVMGGTLVHIMCGFRLGPEAMAALRACANLTRFVNLIVLSAENYLPQASAKSLAFDTPADLHRKTVVMSTLKLCVAFSVLGLGFAVLSPVILKFVYGQRFVLYAKEASVYMLVPLLSGLALPASIFLRTLERSRSLFAIYVLSILPVAVLADPLIKHFGLMGAVMCLLISQALFFVMVLLEGFRIRKQSLAI
jgi:O-antigen/teichoic acid export membrane protein